MACFHQAQPPLNTQSRSLSRINSQLLIMLVAVMQITLSSNAFAIPDNPKLANEKCLR